jgi:6-pyruvoyltetrahydropterin/6-carboxytetrahydropterin synthase
VVNPYGRGFGQQHQGPLRRGFPGKEFSMYRVTRRFTFEAAHYLEDYDGPCSNIHGHSYKVDVTVTGARVADGMVLDFKNLKAVVNSVLEGWDHALIVERRPEWLPETFHVSVLGKRPTAENMAFYLRSLLDTRIRNLDPNWKQELRVSKVRVWETENCYAEAGE